MREGNRNLFETTLRLCYPVAKYAGLLLIALNLHRLHGQVEALPGILVPRWTLMLWVFLLMALGYMADKRLEKERQKDGETQSKTGMNALSFLALADPGFLLLDAAAIAHLYDCWFQGGSAEVLWLPTAVMAVGCVLWIYGNALPSVPYGSVWGVRTEKTLHSQVDWRMIHNKYACIFRIVGVSFLMIGSFL
ncbi:MAG: hypothetical protein IK099_09910 [Clostridia bacterium]|nr:hypothetical protein [Clostridia bacterium]